MILLLAILPGCSGRQPGTPAIQEHNNAADDRPSAIAAIDRAFPLRLSEIDLEDSSNTVHLNDDIVSKIDETIKEHADNVYINTIRLRDSLQTIFLVLLKYYPTGEVNSRVLFYDNQKKAFADPAFDFKLYALYDFGNGNLIPTNLKTELKITAPEIELVDFDKDGINDYKFVRLWHNGTFNAIHTTVLTVRNMELDTLCFNEEPIGNEAFR